MKRWLGLIPLLIVLSACDVASVESAPSTIARNECQSNADCNGGTCIANECRSSQVNAAFQSVLLEVTPPADGSAIAGLQFLQDQDLSDESASLDLGSIAQVAGRVKTKDRKCPVHFLDSDGSTLANPMDGSVPARVSLIPASSALGLYSRRTVVRADLRNGVYNGFFANVPSGIYDIYIEPNHQPDESCPVPPQLTRGQKIESGTLEIFLPEPSTFEFHVSWPPENGTLSGWTVDMLDPGTGYVISNRVPLALATGKTDDYVASLAYAPPLVVSDPKGQSQDQWFRLSPPEGLPANQALPTVLVARSGLGLFAARAGTLSKFGVLAPAVHVHAEVTAGDTPNPVAATVTLAASAIAGIDPGVLASFVRTISVGDDGKFDVYLPPGQYTVSAVPQESVDPTIKNDMRPLAAVQQKWTIASTPEEQAGKVIALDLALSITGQVFDASDRPVATAQVQAVASPLSVQADVLQQALTGSPFVPRSSVGAVNSNGDFALKTDPGFFDISVRTDEGTGFAWLVMPNVEFAASSFGVGLGRIRMPLPVPYRGTVTAGGVGGPTVPNALIRAYLYLKANEYTALASEADSVVQVAETRADKNGDFELLIPAQLNRPGE